MPWFKIVALLIFIPLPLAMADPQKDAQAIVDATVSEELMIATFSSLTDLITAGMQNEAAKAGQPLSDDASKLLGDMMVARMLPYLLTEMRAEMASAYVHAMSPEALAGFRAFLETPAGTEWASAQSALVLESTKMGQRIAEPVALKAVNEMIEDIKSDKWPSGTLSSTKAEIRQLVLE